MSDTTKDAVPPSDERTAFKEFYASLARLSANTSVPMEDRVMILSNATFLLDEYNRTAAFPAGKAVEPSNCHDACDICWGENGQKWPCAKRIRSSPTAPMAMSELREAARQFHNLTQGDPTVIIRPPSAEKRDAIIAAGERLRAALVASSTGDQS